MDTTTGISTDEENVPVDFDDLKIWARQLNAEHLRVQELHAARQAAVDAVMASFNVVLTPHEDRLTHLIDGITRYVSTNLTELKKRHGRLMLLGVGSIKVTVAQKSVSTKSDAELVRALIDNGLDDYVRWEPRPDKVAIKAASQAGKLGKVLRSAGAYVARHQVATLSLPALDKPIELIRNRYPFVHRNEPKGS